MRQQAAAGLILALGLLVIWIGFTGRLGATLAALICPAQLIDDTIASDPTVRSVRQQAAVVADAENAAIVRAAQARAIGAQAQGQFGG
jgi:hypothetical protein